MSDSAAIARNLQQSGKIADALVAWQQILRAAPNHTEALHMTGICCQQSGLTQDAIHYLQQARQQDRHDPYIAYNLALSLTIDRQHGAALPLALEAARALPNEAPVFLTLGNIHMALCDIPAAISAYDHATLLQPEYPEAIYNRGLCFLLNGDFDRGWGGWEYRWQSPAFTSPARQFPCPQWQGGSLAQQHLHIHAEQGLGDTIQMMRYLPWLLGQAGHISLEVKPALLKLIHETCPDIELLAWGDKPANRPDLHIPMMSLPGIFHQMELSIPPPWNPARQTRPGRAAGTPLNIGLVWAGNPNHPRDDERSIPLPALRGILDIPGLSLFSFQLDSPARAVRRRHWRNQVTDLSAELTDFTVTRDRLEDMDLVISIDSALAHLAAGMGIPVWLLLSHVPDWRWMLERPDSPWYPSLTLYRQQTAGNWEQPIEAILADLKSITL